MSNKIMIVEDKRELSELLKYIFEQFGYRVMLAGDGKEGLKLLENDMPDIIVADIMMPEMDGYTFVTRLEEKENTKNIPVVIMTAKGQTRELFEYKKNVSGFIEKPFQPEELKAIIEKILAKHGKKHA